MTGTVLITGANRGIGLEFVRQYAAKGWRVVATARDPGKADVLAALAATHTDVAIERMDVTDPDSARALAAKLDGQPIDVLINNAGVSGDFRGTSQAFGTLDYAAAAEFWAVNSHGPLIVTEAFYEHVKRSTHKKIVAITALLGVASFKYGGSTGSYWYKISKAAMNAAMVNLAAEAARDNVIVTLLTPGEVAVEKVVDRGPNFISPETSIRGMIGVIDALTMADTGAIIRYNGARYGY
jgi:NAD(P)-dependent dehydrogenase (short-subunit alcohol dehydrogenase family)